MAFISRLSSSSMRSIISQLQLLFLCWIMVTVKCLVSAEKSCKLSFYKGPSDANDSGCHFWGMRKARKGSVNLSSIQRNYNGIQFNDGCDDKVLHIYMQSYQKIPTATVSPLFLAKNRLCLKQKSLGNTYRIEIKNPESQAPSSNPTPRPTKQPTKLPTKTPTKTITLKDYIVKAGTSVGGKFSTLVTNPRYTVENIEGCKEKCDESNLCDAFTYWVQEKWCYARQLRDVKTEDYLFPPRWGFVSAMKNGNKQNCRGPVWNKSGEGICLYKPSGVEWVYLHLEPALKHCEEMGARCQAVTYVYETQRFHMQKFATMESTKGTLMWLCGSTVPTPRPTLQPTTGQPTQYPTHPPTPEPNNITGFKQVGGCKGPFYDKSGGECVGECQKYDRLMPALNACKTDTNCSSVTYLNKKFELRKSSELSESTDKEISWICRNKSKELLNEKGYMTKTGFIGGRVLKIVDDAKKITKCKIACINTKHCVAFTYKTKEHKCWLKGIRPVLRAGLKPDDAQKI